MNEIGVLIRSITDIKLSVDEEHRSFSLEGTAGQVDLADSLCRELISGAAQSGAYEYEMATGDQVRVLYLPHTATVRDFQMVVTTIRSVIEIRRAFTYNARRAMVVRGTADQVRLTEWVTQQLDRAPGEPATSGEYRVAGAQDEIVRVYALRHFDGEPDMQQLATLVRKMGNIRRLFSTYSPPAIALRGASDQMAAAEFLFEKLDRSASAPLEASAGETGREFRMSDGEANVLRVFYLNSGTIQDFQTSLAAVRAMENAPLVASFNALGALAVRGTAGQVAAAQALIEERSKRAQR